MSEECHQTRSRSLCVGSAINRKGVKRKIRKFAAIAKNMITKECLDENCYLCFDPACKCECHEAEREADQTEDEEDGGFEKDLGIDDFEEEF